MSTRKKLSIYLLCRLKKLFLLFLCLKFLLIDPFSCIPSKAQEASFNLIKTQSPTVSFNTSLLPTTIKLSSLPVSFSLSNSANKIKLTSLPVSFNSQILPNTVKLSSLPVSYSLNKTADLIKLSSLPVSYSLSSLNRELLKAQSNSVSYKTSNGIPILSLVSPNLLPISQDGKLIDVSLKGQNFTQYSIALIGTLKIQTKYISSKELVATVPANFVDKQNSFEIFVANPPPDGGVSQGFNLMVVEAVPIAKINATPNIGVSPQIVTFDGQDTEDLLAKYYGQKLSYLWDFGENNDGGTSTNVVATHKYSKPGKYQVKLTVLNAYGKTSTITKEVEIRDKDEAPVVDASYAISEKDDSLEVMFDASMSSDPEGDPISFKWSVEEGGNEGEGDGGNHTEPVFTYLLMNKGTYIPKITVTDSLGVESTKFLDPINYLGPNTPPTPIVNISPSEGFLSLKENSSVSSLLVKLSSKDSFDKDGSIANYKWTITGGDLNEAREGDEVNYEFTKAGTYNVKLVITDDRNKTIEKTETIKVLKPEPIANAQADKTNGQAPLFVQFMSSGSQDFDGSLVNVKWNFGDGSPDSIETNPIHTYNQPGAYLATLTVSTTDGRVKKTTTKTIIASENSGPQGIISILEPLDLSVQNEAMIKLSAKGSLDRLNSQMLSYSWSWIAYELDKDKNLVDISEVINKALKENISEDFSYTFTVPGQYTPVLEAKTEDGRTNRTNGETITILPGQNPVAIAKITSDKLSGVDSLPVMFDALGSYDPKTDGQILSYLWEFGDGETSSEISPEHTYNLPGTYNAKLTIQDNRGFKATALANTVKVVSSEEHTLSRVSEILKAPEVKEKILKLQVGGDPSPLAQDKAFSFSFAKDEEKPEDSTPPQISLSITNTELKAGEILSLNAHITDDVGVETVGYKLVDENNHPVIDLIEEAPGNSQIDDFMAHVDFVKNISVPLDTNPGKYRLLLFAKDKADNWLGKSGFVGCHPEQSEGSSNVNGSFVANAPQDDTSCQIISSDINIIGKSDKITSTIIESEDLDEKSNADVIHELDNALANKSIEEKSNVIQLVASEKKNDVGTGGLGGKGNRARTVTLREKTQAPPVQSGKPAASGAPSSNNITNTVNPALSVVMTSASGTPYIDLSVAGTVASKDIKNYTGLSVSLTSTAPNPQTPSQPVIQSHFSITCAAGKDCSVYAEKLNEINQPRVTYVPVDNLGNPIGEEESYDVSPDDLIPNQDPSKYTPAVDSISPNNIVEGSGAFNLTVNGSMFNTSSTVIWNNNELKTDYIDSMTLSALVPAWFTLNSQKLRIKVRKIADKNGKTYESLTKDFEVKSKSEKYFAFSTDFDLTKEIKGNDPVLARSGGNVYVSNDTTVFKEAGEIAIPFNVSSDSNLSLEIIGSLIHASTTTPTVNLYLNNYLLNSLTSTQKCLRLDGDKTCTENQRWTVNLGKLPLGPYNVKLSLPDNHGETIFVLDKINFNFTSAVKPQITSITPNSIYPENENDRTLEITGANFGKSPQVLYKDKPAQILSSTENKVTVKLPTDLGLLADQDSINISLLNVNKSSGNYVVKLRAPLSLSELNANYVFDTNSASGNLEVNAKSGKSVSDFALIGIFDKAGNVTLNPYGRGSIKPNVNNPSSFNAFFNLPYDLSRGTYHVIVLLKRKSLDGLAEDYSDQVVKKLFDDLTERKITSESDFNLQLSSIPSICHKTFNVGINAAPLIKLSGAYTTNGTNFIQENQEISASVDIKGNVTSPSELNININFGDGIETGNGGMGEGGKHVYMLSSGDKFKEFKVIAKVLKNGIEVGRSNEEPIFVYKDIPPVAVAKVDTENYSASGDAPFMSGFVDKSFDPNDELTDFSGALDRTVPERNLWKLFKYKDGSSTSSNQLIDTEDLSVIGNQILSNGKTFLTGNILNPGTYYTRLTAFDRAGNSDTTQSETIQVTIPSQKLLVYAGFESMQFQAFEYDSLGKVKVQFKSKIQIRGNKQPKNIIYNWDFGDGTKSNELNPLYTYKRSQTNHDSIDYHPELTVTAIWEGGYSETWSSKAGTVSIIDKPEFVALEIAPDIAIGNTPLTVNFMISGESFVKNSTVTSYSFDFGDSSTPQNGSISATGTQDLALNELKQKTFTHTYTGMGDFSPVLKVKTKENPDKEYTFNSPIISTNSLLVTAIEVLEPQDNFITNEPIQTFKIRSAYTNPLSDKNRLTIHVTDEGNNETITELDPGSTNQTISLSEGVNTYWFELIDAIGAVQKSVGRRVVLDTVQPAINNVSASLDQTTGKFILNGNIIEKQLQKIELQLDNGNTLILSSDDIKLAPDEDDKYSFVKTLENVSSSYHNLVLRVYDYAGNISESLFQANKQTNSVFLEQVASNDQYCSYPPPKTVSNATQHTLVDESQKYILNSCPVISGQPFSFNVFTCFTDDGGPASVTQKHVGPIEVFFDLDRPKVEVSYNSLPSINVTDSVLKYATKNVDRCFDINSFPGNHSQPFCSETAYNTCARACAKLDGPLCGADVFISSNLNNYNSLSTLSDLFKPLPDPGNNIDPFKQWDVGHYEFKFTVNENPVSCNDYGTCLGSNASYPKTSETYTYIFDVKRQPEIIYPRAQDLKLTYNQDNETIFQFTANDNIRFDLSTNRIPTIGNPHWKELSESESPTVSIISQAIDPIDPRNYVFKLKTNIHPKSLSKLNLEIPVTFPKDYFNPGGITVPATLTFKIVANLGAEIKSPLDGTIIKNKSLLVTSKVKKPQDLEGELSQFNNCKKSVINYEVETLDGKTKILEKLPQNGKDQKIASQGIVQSDGLGFTNLLNFDLKNINEFKKDFLSGKILGPIKLYGAYSTDCNNKNISFNGTPKTYILLDNSRLSKGKCKYPKNGTSSKCEFIVSTNTLLDSDHALSLEIIPNTGMLDPGCVSSIPAITFEKENKLTKTISVDCLPKEATSFDVKLKRNPKFLQEIQDKTDQDPILMSTIITSNDNAVIADRKQYDVKNTPEEAQGAAFIKDDPDGKTATFNGKTISVGELKELLLNLGLITQDQKNAVGYTNDINQAYWKLACSIEDAKKLVSDPSLRFQTADNPLKCTVSEFVGYPDVKYVEDVSLWREFVEGLKTRVGQDISAYVNPTTIATIAAFIVLGSTISINPWIILVAGFIGTSVDVGTRINDVKALWSNSSDPNFAQTSHWKMGYSIGTLLTAVPVLIPANVAKNVKVAEAAAKLDDFTNLQDLITSEQRIINSLSGLESTAARQENLNNFVTFLKDIPAKVQNYDLSGLSLLDKTISELKPLGEKDKLLELFAKDTAEVRNVQILKNILIDEVQAETVTRAGKQLAKDLANVAISTVNDLEYKPLSTYFNNKGYDNISKSIPRTNIPRFLSRFVQPSDLKKYNLPNTDQFKDLSSEQIIQKIDDNTITKEDIIGKISSGSMANYFTPTDPIKNLTASEVNGSTGLGLGILENSDFKGLVEIQIDISKLPLENEFRLPISVLGNQYFKPAKLDSNSGVTIGGYLEWSTSEFSAEPTNQIITNIRGLSR